MTTLHVEEWGTGGRTAVLLHGLSGGARSWAAIAEELVRRGYRVLAPELTGHGRSPRASYSRERWADDLLENLPAAPELAIGHSLGGVLLAMIADRLRPARAVYEDPAWYPWAGPSYGETQPGIRAMKALAETDLRAANPRWSEAGLAARLAELREWDPETTRMAYLETAYVPVFPVVPSLLVLADPSPVLAPAIAEHFADVGFESRVVAGAGHFVHLDAHPGFVAALDGWA
ncbi:alpha/beta hydrolase [Amycolatopsis acidicola]|uniref:Alpha/beta hydrolase n=1 Tax=Amycolatopsis acidicola TaxID=2596893 RepID=A0A5N0VBM2_9PSEU|nr:alpha/beta hydrolase [Amycolatopsis acidicola]KAA9162968.1 alpha/beta hydrolase [Amycolatopsis acidicola]